MRCACVIAAVMLASAPAHADVSWDAPDGCPDADAVRAQVAQQLGREPADGDLDVELRVARDGDRWRLDMTAGGGERTLEAATCDELAQSAALIVAMTIEAAESDAVDVASLGDLERPPAPVLTRRREIDISDREASPPPPWKLRGRVFAVGDLGTMPEPAIGAGGAIELALGAWGIEVTAARMAPQRETVPGMPDNGAEMSLTTIATRLCYTAVRRRFASSGCVGGEVEIVGAEGFGFDDPIGRTTTFGGGPQLAIAWAYRVLGPIAARVDVATGILVVRPVLIEGTTGAVIHDPNVLIWRGSFGFEATW